LKVPLCGITWDMINSQRVLVANIRAQVRMVGPVARTSGVAESILRGDGDLEMSGDSKAIFKRAVPYADDAMNLPVADVDAAIPYYERPLGFASSQDLRRRTSRSCSRATRFRSAWQRTVAIRRRKVVILKSTTSKLLFAEIKGKQPADGDLKINKHGDSASKVFFAIAPDGLCYMIGQPSRAECERECIELLIADNF